MGVQLDDRTTLDMFADRARGRPKSNPYPREVQIRVNKRQQRCRDKEKGLRRLEVKVPAALIDQLDEIVHQTESSRSEVIEWSIKEWLAHMLDEDKG